MFRRILIPVDGTRQEGMAPSCLEEMFDCLDHLVLLTVAKEQRPARSGFLPGRAVPEVITGSATPVGAVLPDTPVYRETTDQASQREKSELEDYLCRLAEGLRERGFEVQTEVLLEDDPAEAIVEYARKTKPTMIVMLLHAHNHLGDVVFGSVAQEVAKAEVAPIAFVPHNSWTTGAH